MKKINMEMINRKKDMYISKSLEKNIYRVVVGILLLVSSTTIGDAFPVEEWNKTFGGINYDIGRSVQQTSDGGYIIAGVTNSYSINDVGWLIKTDSNGKELWNKTFGGTYTFYGFNSVQQTSDGGYILAGVRNQYNTDILLIKTDDVGNQQWSKIFGGIGNDGAYSVQQTSDGGYIVAGWTDSYGAGLQDTWLIKTDLNGDEQWDRTYGGSDNDWAYSVRQISDGGYVLSGYSYSWNKGYQIKTDGIGNELWNKSFGIYGFHSLQYTSDGNYIIARDGSGDAMFIKADANGNQLWSKTFGGTDYDEAESVYPTSDGGYIVAGETRSYGAGTSDAWLVKFSSDTGSVTPTITPCPPVPESCSPPIAPLSVKITSPSSSAELIEDKDNTFTSQVSGGVPPYKYTWTWLTLKGPKYLSSSENLIINFYNNAGGVEFLEKLLLRPPSSTGIELEATDANGVKADDTIFVYLVPPEPSYVSFEVWQNGKVPKYIPDRKDKYKFVVKIKNIDDNPHYYGLQLKTPPENPRSPPRNCHNFPTYCWDLNIKTDSYSDWQNQLILPGNTGTYYYEFKSTWDWIPEKSIMNMILKGLQMDVLKELAKKTQDAYLVDIIKLLDIYAEYEIAEPKINFRFMPVDTAFAFKNMPNIETKLYVGTDKVMSYQFYLIDKLSTMPSFYIAGKTKNPYVYIVGLAGIIDSMIQYQKATDPSPYTEIVRPEPYNIPELDSYPQTYGISKDAARTAFDMLSYKRAEEISYVRYLGAIEDGSYEYAKLQLEATKKYSDIWLEKSLVMNNYLKAMIQGQQPLTEKDMEEYKYELNSKGLPTDIVNILTREGMEDEIPALKEFLLNSDLEMSQPSLITDYSKASIYIQTSFSNEYIKDIIEINVDKLGQQVTDGSLSEIERLETLKADIQTDLDKGYATNELRDNIKQMLDLANNLILNTNNDKYLDYYNFARNSWSLYANMPLYKIIFLPPITTMQQFNLTNGSTLPIKFTARNNITNEFIYDDSVNVTITNSTGNLVAKFTNGTGTNNVRINSAEEQYIVNLHTKDYNLKIGETYIITVTFGDSSQLKGYEVINFVLVEGGKAKGKD